MSKPAVTVYSTSWCGYSVRARKLLEHYGIPFHEINVEDGAHLRQEMIKRSGRRSVPQIFFGDLHIGGSEELAALASDGQLHELLAVGG